MGVKELLMFFEQSMNEREGTDMGDRRKGIVAWLLTVLLVAGVVTGCAGGLAGQGQQDRSGIPRQQTASLQVETQSEQKELSLGAAQEAEPGPSKGEEIQGAAERPAEGHPQTERSAQAESPAQTERSARIEGQVQTERSAQAESPAQTGRSAQAEDQARTERSSQSVGSDQTKEREMEGPSVEEDGSYTSKEEVALYIHLYGHLPENYITKREAEDSGWDSRQGNLAEVAPGMSIGGSRFGNYEGQLPDKEGRQYYECDIGYVSGRRGAERLVYSNDGLVFYTGDHYKTFEQLY